MKCNTGKKILYNFHYTTYKIEDKDHWIISKGCRNSK